MPKIVQRTTYNGAEEKIARLGLKPLWTELERILTRFDLRVEERRDANGGAALRRIIDARFAAAKGWAQKTVGGVDWIKCLTVNGTKVCVGVEIQVSARSDLLIRDVVHLRNELIAGSIDVAVIVAPSDKLGVYLTDRGPKFRDANAAIKEARAEDLPFFVIGLEHDGPGPALKKERTRQGKAGTE